MFKRLINSFIAILVCVVSCSKDPGQNPSGGGLGSDGIMPSGPVTISGKVLDQTGKALEGVVVSDGFKSYKTDGQGVFRIDSDLSKAKFVSVSIPDGYKVPCSDGLPIFYKRLSDVAKTNGVYQNLVFRLEKMMTDKCTLIFVADPQPRAKTESWDKIAYHSIDVADALYEDLKTYVATLDGEVFGMMLGDIVHENMSLYQSYVQALSNMSLPMFNVIGNHDYNLNKQDDISAAEDYEKWLGPTNYSFNLCGFHVVVVDGIIMKDNGTKLTKDYIYGLSDEVYGWLSSDLRFVSKNTPILFCSHAQMFSTGTSSDRWNSAATVNGKKYAQLLGTFDKVYSWAGHAHQTYNTTGKGRTYPNVESHTLSRSTGDMWTNEWINPDGVPRGYVVAQLAEGRISWKYKNMAETDLQHLATKQPTYKWKDVTSSYDAQVRAYPKGAYGDGYVYANVFLYDEDWKSIKYVPASGNSSNMTRYETYDLAYKEVHGWYSQNDAILKNNLSEYTLPDKRYQMFRCSRTEVRGSGCVEVTDRFGNKYRSNTISW